MKRPARLPLRQLCAWLLALVMLIGCMTASAETDTTLTVQLKGITYDSVNGWRPVTLSAPILVLSTDGDELGQLTAGSGDSLSLTGVSEVLLRPVETELTEGYVFNGDSRAAITSGQNNLATVFAYAEQGYFSFAPDEDAAGEPDAAYTVLDEEDTVVLSFTTDAQGAYRSIDPLPVGEYRLAQPNESSSMQTVLAVFQIQPYFGKESDIVTVHLSDGMENQESAVVVASDVAADEQADVKATAKPDTDEQTRTAAAAAEADSAASAEKSSAANTTAASAENSSAANTATTTATATATATPTPAPTATPAPIYGSIEGCAFVDGDQNLLRAEGDTLMVGVEVALQKQESGSWNTIQTAATDEYGHYLFEQLPAGEYRVCARTDAVDYFAAAVGGSAQTVEGTTVACSQALTLAEGDDLTDVADIALHQPAALHFIAFADGNSDGARGVYDSGIAGVQVEVLYGQSVLASGTTDSNGELTLAGLVPGQYVLQLTAPGGYGYTVQGQQSCAAADGATAQSEPITFASAQVVETGVGLMKVGSFSGKVFEDLNNDGIMDETDPGVAGVVLKLEGRKKGSTYQAVSGEDGLFIFTSLPDDTYVFTASLPDGMMYARYSKTGGDLRSVFSGEVVSREYSLKNAAQLTDKNVGVVQNGVIAGRAFLDMNYNGCYDEGEPGYAGVTLEVLKTTTTDVMGKTVTAEDGTFRLEGLRSGEYRLRALLPNDGSIFTIVPAVTGDNVNYFEQKGSRRENTIQPLTVQSGGETNALVGVALGATIKGVVFQDNNYNGCLDGDEKRLSGVAVQLVDSQGSVVAAGTTIGDGSYTLSGIMPGTYVLQVKRIKGNGFTRLRPDEEGGNHVVELINDYGITGELTVAMAQTLEDINAGMLPSSTVTGQLFFDQNDDGLISEGEAGMTGANVRLLSDDGEIDLTRSVAEDGTYFFDGVMPGNYTLTYLLPQHAEIARVAEGGNTLENQGTETATAPFSVAMAENHQAPLVGAVVLGSFEGIVFNDSNANGIQDPGESPLAQAEITLTPDVATAEEQTLRTNEDGSFQMTGLRPANYQLTVTLPDGMIFSRSLTGLAFRTVNTQTMSCSWQVLTSRQQQMIGAVKPAGIAGTIWLDENKDGSRGSAELLMSGISLELVDEAAGQTVARVTSTEEGFLFENVRPGTYTLRFSMPNQAEPAQDLSSTFAFSSPYMLQSGVTVAEGQQLTGLTAGLVSKTSIGGKVWLEEGGTQLSVISLTVSLYQTGSDTPLQTVITDENGSYRFDGLWPGEYIIRAALPDGMIFVRPDDANYPQGASIIQDITDTDGSSSVFTLQMAQHRLQENIIFIKPAKVGDQAWLDQNGNGLIDGDEPMIPGVTISLMQNGQAIYQTVTDAYGYYEFDAVYPGSYTLQAAAYPELTITQPVSGMQIISSCLTSGDGNSASSEAFDVVSGSKNMDYNLGYVLSDGQQLPAAITDTTAPQRDWSLSNEKYTALQE